MPELPDSKLAALAESFSAEVGALAKAADLEVEKILEEFVQIARSGRVDARILRDRVLAEVDRVLKTAYGPGSRFEKLSLRYFAKAGKSGFDRFFADAVRYGYRSAFRLSSKDAGSILAASTDLYELAARNLTTRAVEELRQAITEEMLRGGGEKAIRERLVNSGYIRDLRVGNRVLRGETRAAMMARTEPHRVANAAYLEQTKLVAAKAADRFYRWISALGPTVGEDSLRRHGTILSESEWQSADFGDGMYGLPPIRPNDNCSFIFYPRSALPPDLAKIVNGTDAGEARRTVGSSDGPLWQKLYDEKVLKEKRK